jgi:hypothetical protein
MGACNFSFGEKDRREKDLLWEMDLMKVRASILSPFSGLLSFNVASLTLGLSIEAAAFCMKARKC